MQFGALLKKIKSTELYKIVGMFFRNDVMMTLLRRCGGK